MHRPTVLIVLFIVASVNAQCSCQSKPPTNGIDVIYKGEACECGRKYPVQLEVPKITEHRDAHYDYGFTIEKPEQAGAPAEVKYSFDFHMEKPQPPPKRELLNYGFHVETPSENVPEDTKRYRFDYEIQTPLVENHDTNLQGLLAHVDRVVVQKQDCPDKSEYGCNCNRYKPTIDMLQRCPKHGHLYLSGGQLHPSDQQRYNELSNLQQDQVAISSDRSKREITKTFPINIQEILSGLRHDNQIIKLPSWEDQNRISKIMRVNFGEDPNENIDELLRPKTIASSQPVQSELEQADDMELLEQMRFRTPEFIAKIKPKLQEARANIRSQITKIVNKARLEAILSNHMINKRSIDDDIMELSDAYFDDAEKFDGGYEKLWMTKSKDGAEKSSNVKQKSKIDFEDINDEDESNCDRIRKHCDRCGELAKKFPCPSCGELPSEAQHTQYFEMKQGNRVPYYPGQETQTSDQNSQPRYVFDRIGHRYIEKDGKLKLIGPRNNRDEVNVGSYYNGPDAYGELKDIFDLNSKSIHAANRGVSPGHLLQPMNLAHASDAIRFIQELTQKDNKYEEDYYSNGDSYEVGESPKNYPSKRSFEIIPLSENPKDGSVLVKIAPSRNLEMEETKLNEPEKVDFTSEDDDSKTFLSSFEKNIFDEEKPTANFEKFTRNGKKYEILSFSENGSPEESVDSDEDWEIMKYIYAVNQGEHDTENSYEFDNNQPVTEEEMKG